jgi:nucleoside-diphosphate-sugar epimerase
MERLVVGCGYLGLRVAQQWRECGDTVYAVTRWESRAKVLSGKGLRPLVGDLTDLQSWPDLPAVDTLLYAVGWDRSSGKTIREVYVDGLSHLLARLPASIGRFVYISSTGVYGQTASQRVDEESICEPQREGGRACLAAERLLTGNAVADRAVILRLAGIYGPERLPRQADLMAGRPLTVDPKGLINLIHVDDAVSAVLAASTANLAMPRCFTVSDGQPVQRCDFYAELARQLGTDPPQFVEPAPTSNSRGSTSKRVANDRMLTELGVRLRYPSYREGLAAIVADDSIL